MSFDLMALGKAFAPRYISKAIDTFDKASMVIVSVCWGGAIFIMIFAMYTVHLAVEAKRDTVEAKAMQPSLPIMRKKSPKITEMEPIVERLQRRFPNITFDLRRDLSLNISTSDGSMFRNWLTILSYVDTISPEYRWEIREFCVGMRCPSAVPMRAILIAKKITFKAPKAKKD